jgi:uncharacterized membrane protein (DUF373 family)
MNIILKSFERLIIFALITMMVIVILLATVDLGMLIIENISSTPTFLLEVDELLGIFGFVLLIVIGVELVETIKAYFDERSVHVEIVLEVALIAIARKVIIVDIKEFSPQTLLGIAALVIALSVGFYLEKRGRLFAEESQTKTGEFKRE